MLVEAALRTTVRARFDADFGIAGSVTLHLGRKMDQFTFDNLTAKWRCYETVTSVELGPDRCLIRLCINLTEPERYRLVYVMTDDCIRALTPDR